MNTLSPPLRRRRPAADSSFGSGFWPPSSALVCTSFRSWPHISCSCRGTPLSLATLGTLLVLLSLGRRFGVLRLIALLLVGTIAAGEWWFILVYARLPHETGRIVEKQPFPAFTATVASDGSPFTQDSLTGKQNTVIVFFRGHF